jgi:two-component system sensor histidine kinase UhpB
VIANIDRVYGMVTGLIRQLRPAGLDDLGVSAALEHCVNEWRSRLPAAAIELTIRGDFDQTLDETRGLVLYRLVQEALTNIARHSGATKIEISITTMQSADLEEWIEIIIVDNGGGADMRAPQTGLGLVGMRERVSSLGGSLRLMSEPSAGFKIVAALPMAGARS